MKARFAGGRMGRFDLVHKKFCTPCKIFCEQAWDRPPCRRRHSLPGQEPHKSCYLTGVTWSLTWQASAGTTGPTCLRPGGRCSSFAHRICTLCKFCGQKITNIPCGRRRTTPLSGANAQFAGPLRNSCQLNSRPWERMFAASACDGKSYLPGDGTTAV